MSERQIGRIAFRIEKGMWVARYALPDTMEGSLVLGALAMPIAEVPRFKAAFIKVMQDAVDRILLDSEGIKATWAPPVAASRLQVLGKKGK